MANKPQTYDWNFELFSKRWKVPGQHLQRLLGEESFAPWVQGRSHGNKTYANCAPYYYGNSPRGGVQFWPQNTDIKDDGYRPQNSALSCRTANQIAHANIAVMLEAVRTWRAIQESRVPIMDTLDPIEPLKWLEDFIREGTGYIDITTFPTLNRYALFFVYDLEYSFWFFKWGQTEKRVTTWTVGKKPKDQVGIRRSLRMPF